MIDDGSTLTDEPLIQSLCKGTRHTEAHTDTAGDFYFEFGKDRIDYTDVDGSSMGTLQTVTSTGRGTTDRFSFDCELMAVLPGFSSDTVELVRYRDQQMPNINIGKIVLHRLKGAEGLTISATTAAAPPDARKAFEKAREEEAKGKLEDAQKKFQKAVSVYPQFAVAWVELGRLQAHFKNFDVARQSFNHAIDADAKLVTPYLELSQLAFTQRQWEELVNVSGRLLDVNALSYPQAWFYNALGNYYLNHVEAAEKSARQGLKTDMEHHVPKLDYLLGMVLMQKKDYASAAEHFRIYLAHLANPSESASVQAQLADAEQLSKATVGQNAQRK